MMPDSLPPPPAFSGADLRGLSSFMLNVDRLLASELVALGTPEECWAAVMLWCRAWKQSPPASLPDDERVLRGFSGAGARWPRVREMALRGFVKCADGRLYHHVLVEEAEIALRRRNAYQTDQERLRKWRQSKRETMNETLAETELKPVSKPPREPYRQDRTVQDKEKYPPTPRKRGADDDPAFAAFWRAYPRKDDKGHARVAWTKAIRRASADAIVAGLARHVFSPDPQYRPLAATWLNGERWADQAGMPLLRTVERTPENPAGREITPMVGGL